MQFRDLNRQYQALKEEIDEAVSRTLSSGCFIMGEEVERLETLLATYVGAKHCITCGNGTDALALALEVWGIGAGDAVFVPDFTFFATAEVVARSGATPIWVDVDATTYNLSPQSLERAIQICLAQGRAIPKAVIAVDLFGLPAPYGVVQRICSQYNLLLLEDGAQGFGGAIGKQRTLSFGDIATTSFFPAKPLGCYGDGGALFTNNDTWAAQLRSLRQHGKGDTKYHNRYLGVNSRLDALQAAVLQVKFKALVAYELQAINHIATIYRQLLSPAFSIPTVPEGYYSSWAQYTILLPEGVERGKWQDSLRQKGIPTMVYYPVPMHLQEALAPWNLSDSYSVATATSLCRRVLSLPMHPYLTEEEVHQIARELNSLL